MVCSFVSCHLFFFFKQKTAYEMRISDWSSDVCSSDLAAVRAAVPVDGLGIVLAVEVWAGHFYYACSVPGELPVACEAYAAASFRGFIASVLNGKDQLEWRSGSSMAPPVAAFGHYAAFIHLTITRLNSSHYCASCMLSFAFNY